MSVFEASPFPLVGFQAVANVRHEWVAVLLHLVRHDGDAAAALTTLFSYPDMLAALAPLDCIVAVDDPRSLDERALAALPAPRVILRIAAARCAEPAVRDCCKRLAGQGYRILTEGTAGLAGSQAGAQALSADGTAALPPPGQLMLLPGPHLAHHVDSMQRLAQCSAHGFAWFAGAYPLHPCRDGARDDGTTRKRLLALLGLLARDADAGELEVLLKQDPALSYQLLKLVNSAAFAVGTPITSFRQAINLLGRRQLQRWLQLLLYARQQDNGAGNPLLPLAAVRAAQMEMLCKLGGGDREQQDAAFLAGVFSLLDVLLDMPMDEVIGALSLAPEVALALSGRGGVLGAMLALAEGGAADDAALGRVGIDAETYWRSLLQAYHWALQVSRNL